MQPVLHPIRRFCDVYGLGRTKTYQLINEGRLESVKVDGRRFITEASARRLMLGEAA